MVRCFCLTFLLERLTEFWRAARNRAASCTLCVDNVCRFCWGLCRCDKLSYKLRCGCLMPNGNESSFFSKTIFVLHIWVCCCPLNATRPSLLETCHNCDASIRVSLTRQGRVVSLTMTRRRRVMTHQTIKTCFELLKLWQNSQFDNVTQSKKNLTNFAQKYNLYLSRRVLTRQYF